MTNSATLYTRIGGEAGISALVDAYLRTLCTHPDFSDLRTVYQTFGTSLERYRVHLKEYLAGCLGGPAVYQERHGLPMLRERHRKIAIGEKTVSDWTRCMSVALEIAVSDASLRTELEGVFAYLAESLRND